MGDFLVGFSIRLPILLEVVQAEAVASSWAGRLAIEAGFWDGIWRIANQKYRVAKGEPSLYVHRRMLKMLIYIYI